MKKHLSLILRILVATAGLVYIAWIINWTDKVQVDPARAHLTGAAATVHLTKPISVPVISPDFNPQNLQQPVTIELKPGDARTQLTLSPQQLKDPNSGFILHPGIITTLKHARLWLLLLGLIIVAPIYPITVFRWWMLLKTRGLEVPPLKAFRLCMVGCFFNYCMPGSTGGDVIKAYYAARNSDRRADAVMTVIIDRIVGLLGLFILAGVAGAFLPHADSRVHKVILFVWGIAAVVVLVSAFYFSRRLRKASGLDWLLTRLLPKDSIFAKVDQAAAAYSHHKLVVLGSILLSLPVHILLAISSFTAGRALGMDTHLMTFLTVIPVLFLVMAIPISPQGAGTTELVAILLLVRPGSLVTPNQVVVMLIMIRLYQLVYSLSGSVFLLQGDIHMYPQRVPEPEPQSAVA